MQDNEGRCLLAWSLHTVVVARCGGYPHHNIAVVIYLSILNITPHQFKYSLAAAGRINKTANEGWRPDVVSDWRK